MQTRGDVWPDKRRLENLVGRSKPVEPPRPPKPRREKREGTAKAAKSAKEKREKQVGNRRDAENAEGLKLSRVGSERRSEKLVGLQKTASWQFVLHLAGGNISTGRASPGLGPKWRAEAGLREYVRT